MNIDCIIIEFIETVKFKIYNNTVIYELYIHYIQ